MAGRVIDMLGCGFAVLRLMLLIGTKPTWLLCCPCTPSHPMRHRTCLQFLHLSGTLAHSLATRRRPINSERPGRHLTPRLSARRFASSAAALSASAAKSGQHPYRHSAAALGATTQTHATVTILAPLRCRYSAPQPCAHRRRAQPRRPVHRTRGVPGHGLAWRPAQGGTTAGWSRVSLTPEMGVNLASPKSTLATGKVGQCCSVFQKYCGSAIMFATPVRTRARRVSSPREPP